MFEPGFKPDMPTITWAVVLQIPSPSLKSGIPSYIYKGYLLILCSKKCLTYHIINMPNTTHCGLSISMCRASSSSSSGKTGASLSTVVSRLTVETVTSNRNAVSTNEHLLTGLQCKIDVPNGIKMAARAQSTTAWWNRRPWLHLREKCILLLIKRAVHTQALFIYLNVRNKSFERQPLLFQIISNRRKSQITCIL